VMTMTMRFRIPPFRSAVPAIIIGCALIASCTSTPESAVGADPASPVTAAPQPTPTAIAQPTSVQPPATPTAEPIPTSEPTATPEAMATPEPTATPEPAATTEPTATSTPATEEPEPTATTDPTATVEPTATTVDNSDRSDQWWPRGEFDLCVTGIAASDTLNLRTGPTTSAPMVSELSPDQCGITPLGPSVDGWAPVRVSQSLSSRDVFVGFAFDTFLSLGRPAIETAPFNANLVDPVWCAAGSQPLELRLAPDPSAQLLHTVEPGVCRLFPMSTDISGKWVIVSVDDVGNPAGWVQRIHIKSTEPEIEFAADAELQPVRFQFIASDLPGASVPTNILALAPNPTGASRLATIGLVDLSQELLLPATIDPLTMSFRGWTFDRYCVTTTSSVSLIEGAYVAEFGPTLCV